MKKTFQEESVGEQQHRDQKGAMDWQRKVLADRGPGSAVVSEQVEGSAGTEEVETVTKENSS